MWFFTGKGDEGKANLFDGQRLPKSSPIFELIGTLDEATAYLGFARSFADDLELNQDLSKIQDDLSKLMGIVAGAGPAVIGDRFDIQEKLDWLEMRIQFYGEPLGNPHAFVYAGQTTLGSAIDIARTVVRKAERIFTRLFCGEEEISKNLPYLNRLSSLLFILRLVVDNRSNTSR